MICFFFFVFLFFSYLGIDVSAFTFLQLEYCNRIYKKQKKRKTERKNTKKGDSYNHVIHQWKLRYNSLTSISYLPNFKYPLSMLIHLYKKREKNSFVCDQLEISFQCLLEFLQSCIILKNKPQTPNKKSIFRLGLMCDYSICRYSHILGVGCIFSVTRKTLFSSDELKRISPKIIRGYKM